MITHSHVPQAGLHVLLFETLPLHRFLRDDFNLVQKKVFVFCVEKLYLLFK